jgi:hypothetical protein
MPPYIAVGLRKRPATHRKRRLQAVVTQGIDRMMRYLLAMGGLVALLQGWSPHALRAAELSPPQAQGPVAAPSENCGPCGCLQVTYDYHRELRTTYGLNYDPRNFDTAEPYFYFGQMRAYPRYFANGVPLPHC